MARLIDADTIFNNELLLVSDKAYDAVHAVIERINNAPTVDAVEVVRCKDCRFFEDEDYYGNCYCEEWGNITNANGYCHDAERRTDETN